MIKFSFHSNWIHGLKKECGRKLISCIQECFAFIIDWWINRFYVNNLNLKILIHLKFKLNPDQVDKLSLFCWWNIYIWQNCVSGKLQNLFSNKSSHNLIKMSFEIWREIRSGPLCGTLQINILQAKLRAIWLPPSVQQRTYLLPGGPETLANLCVS